MGRRTHPFLLVIGIFAAFLAWAVEALSRLSTTSRPNPGPGGRNLADKDDDMGRHRATEADPRHEAARLAFELEIRRAKALERERKRAAGSMRFTVLLAAIGMGLMTGGLVGNLLIPLAGVGAGFMAAALTLMFGGALARRAARRIESSAPSTLVERRPQIAAPALSDDSTNGRNDAVRELLEEAAAALRALDALVPRLRHPESKASAARIVAVGLRIMNEVAARPERLATAQRVFTYYAPESVKVAEALAALESDPHPDMERIAGTQTVMKKLEVLFDRVDIDLKADDRREIDIDLRLLDQSIEADLKGR